MKTIAIVAGGDSSEHEISIKSAQGVQSEIGSIYNTYIIEIKGFHWFWKDAKGECFDIDKNDFSLTVNGKKITFDAVFVAIHGTPGENGLLQGYFDMLKMPYTSCDSFCSALTFKKHACKLFLKEYDIPMANAAFIRKGQPFSPEDIVKQLGLPCFVKPNDSGSSFGVTKVKSEDMLIPAIDEAFKESDEVLIESFMKGREVACAVFKTADRSKSIVFPVSEIISKNEFFDYEAKYTPGLSDEVTPAEMEEEIIDRIQERSSQIYDLLGCSGIVRVDFIVIDGIPNFLEINTVPGMTRESLFPKQAKAAGIALKDIYSMAIEECLKK